MSIAISINELSRYYGNYKAVDSINLEVNTGSIFGFLGPNGAGKTTTIRILLGLIKASQGTASIFGKSCWKNTREIKKLVGYISGDLNLYPSLNGKELLRIARLAHGHCNDSYADELAEYFELDLSDRIRNMSRGMKQKLGLISAMAHRPKLLILDEPSTGLDPLIQEKLRSRLLELSNEGVTVFFSSHSLAEVEQLCQHVAIIRKGKIVANQSLAALRQKSGHQVGIRWKNSVDIPAPPAFLKINRETDDYWLCLTDQPIRMTIGWLADKPVDDLTITKPDLETVFKQYYSEHKKTESNSLVMPFIQ